MNDKRSNKILWWLGCLLAILMLLLEFPLQWLNDFDYNKLLQIVPYKWQLLIWLLTILLIILAFTYRKAFPTKSNNEDKLKFDDDNKMTEERKKMMENLSTSEVTVLMYFLKENSKVVFIRYNSVVKVLSRNRIVKCLSYEKPPVPSEIMIQEWAWEWIKKNESKLKSKI